ncbi:sulfurtransferase-like selenium metabolism protein YedF [Youngiibacter fragilis]|uniref:Response regulator SirA n=1 Tax=Youngiibacter fragilis 232.1 TaxID=994573 RepID=V7I2P7_9CLOT|nr:sulfurtransferase-like selenium metabolism protein YedF [Youngiibacter fragilis]ETA80123.1 response regulator SirA [Youngiibacter fragilis 232.1]
MKKELDARGKACPIPVVETKKLLAGMASGDTVVVTVDNYVAVQNLSKMASQKNIPVSSIKVDESEYVVTLTMTETAPEAEDIVEAAECIPDGIRGNTVVVLSSDKMGEGDEKLGRTLMKGFIYALTEQDILPKTILLYNNGAKLSVHGSDSLPDLKLLESQGVEILTCGTCLNFYGITEKLGVGSVTNMYVIAEKQMKAAKIVKP